MGMGKVVRRENIRVEIEPEAFGYYSNVFGNYTREQIDAKRAANAEDIVEQVKRHVDDYRDVSVVWDSVTVCEFCENPWETCTADSAFVGEPEGLPMCCDAAQTGFWRANSEQWEISKTYEPWVSVGGPWLWDEVTA